MAQYPVIRISQEAYDTLLTRQKACKHCRSFVNAVDHLLKELDGDVPHPVQKTKRDGREHSGKGKS